MALARLSVLSSVTLHSYFGLPQLATNTYIYKKFTMKISNDKLYCLCNKYQWFTSGDNRQYKLLFDLNKHDAELEMLATIIWLFSDGYNEQTILDILKKECDI